MLDSSTFSLYKGLLVQIKFQTHQQYFKLYVTIVNQTITSFLSHVIISLIAQMALTGAQTFPTSHLAA